MAMESKGRQLILKLHPTTFKKAKKRLNTILAENTGKSIDEAAIATERDNYMTAEEAMNFGLIDKIIDRR